MACVAAFGISDRVVHELTEAYPQVDDPAWLDANASNSLFYWNYRLYGWYNHRHNGPFDRDAVGRTGPGISGPAPACGGTSSVGRFSDLGSQLNSGLADASSIIDAVAPSTDSGGDFSSFGSGGDPGFGGLSGGPSGGSFGGQQHIPMSERIVRALGLNLVGALILAALCTDILILDMGGVNLNYRTLDHDVTVTVDDDLKVTEHIGIKLRKRKDDDGKTKP